jgi:hypothetical protein
VERRLQGWEVFGEDAVIVMFLTAAVLTLFVVSLTSAFFENRRPGM